MAGSTSESLLQQVTPLASPVFALLGVWVGKVLERRSSRTTWRRDQRSKAALGFLQATHDMWRHAQKMWMAQPTRARSTKHIAHLNELLVATGRAESSLAITGPRSLTLSAEAVTDALDKLADLLCDTTASANGHAQYGHELDKTPQGVALVAAEAAFVKAAEIAVDS